MTEQKYITIDLEPTWESLCNMSDRGILPAKELMPACKIADTIRQAQKNGAKGIVFTFNVEGYAEFEIVTS